MYIFDIKTEKLNVRSRLQIILIGFMHSIKNILTHFDPQVQIFKINFLIITNLNLKYHITIRLIMFYSYTLFSLIF